MSYKAHKRALKNYKKSSATSPDNAEAPMMKVHEPQLVIIRNKKTKEVVDIEVRVQSLYLNQGVKRKIVLVVHLIVFFKLIVFALLFLYLT